MTTFLTPGPISASVQVAEIGVSEGTAARVDATSERGSVHNSVPSPEDPGTFDTEVTVHARTRYGDIVVQRAAS